MNFGPTVRHLNIDQIQKYFRIILFFTFSYSGEPVEWIRDFRGNFYSLVRGCVDRVVPSGGEACW